MSMATGAEGEINNAHIRTVEEALRKVYICKATGSATKINVPRVLFGKRVRLVLVEEQNETS